MSLANGNPVFLSVGVLPDGATDPIDLATVASTATSASTSASSAVTAANAAAASAGTALTTANAAIPKSALGAASGVATLDANSSLLSVNGSLSLGVSGSGTSIVTPQIQVFGSGKSGTDAFISFGGGTGNNDAQIWIGGSQITTYVPFPIGTASNPFSGAVLQSAVQVVSDENEKNIVGTVGDSAYVDSEKLVAAWDAISAAVYTLKSSTNADPRKHIGVIAQTVHAAFTAQGLEPSNWGIWCETPLTKGVTNTIKDAETGEEKTVTTEEPVYEADGKTQVMRQSVRYEELLTLGVFCERIKSASLEARIAALEAKIAPSSAT